MSLSGEKYLGRIMGHDFSNFSCGNKGLSA